MEAHAGLGRDTDGGSVGHIPPTARSICSLMQQSLQTEEPRAYKVKEGQLPKDGLHGQKVANGTTGSPRAPVADCAGFKY